VTALLKERQDSPAEATPAPPSPVPDEALAHVAAAHRSDAHILVRDRGRVLILDIAEIDWVEADGDHVRLHAAGRGHLLRETMATMEETLQPHRFARIHRSAIVNIARIAEMRALTSREYLVVLHDGTRLRMSRRFRERLQGVLGARI
jgi:two-component system LytT family response regulator